MTIDSTRIAAVILADVASVSNLSSLTPEDLRIQLWHIVADIAAAEYRREPNGTPVPNINSLTDAVLPIVASALKKR